MIPATRWLTSSARSSTLECRRVLCTDPFIVTPSFVSLETALDEADFVFLALATTNTGTWSIEKPSIDVFGFFRPPAEDRRREAIGGLRLSPASGADPSRSEVAGRMFHEDLGNGFGGIHRWISRRGTARERPRGRGRSTISPSTAISSTPAASNPRYRLVRGDAKDVDLQKDLLADCDHMIAGAAMIGGISYFHSFAYDLLAENERITAAAFDAAIWAHRAREAAQDHGDLLVDGLRECHEVPDAEGEQRAAARRRRSTYGFQKLAVEYYRPGGPRAIWPPLHHRPAVQLRRYRRAPCAVATRRSSPATSGWP